MAGSFCAPGMDEDGIAGSDPLPSLLAPVMRRTSSE
jgi:hypothetical protein